MSKAQASKEHMYRVFTTPEGQDSTLAQLERHLSDNLSDFLSQHVVSTDTSLERIEGDFADALIPEEPEFVSTHAEQLLKKVVAHSVNTYSPAFIGHMTSALPYFHLTLAKLLVGLNQNLVKIETSKAFTPMERQVLGMMHNLIYAKDSAFYSNYLHSASHALGAFCSGGTVANMTALWVARNTLLAADANFGGVMQEGLVRAYQYYNIADMGIMASARGHYSLGKACDLLGLGRKQLLTVEAPEQCLDPELALQVGRDYQARGNKLLAIVGIAGTTETGHIDPLDELADVAAELNCWFHVDAAWGGATLFSETHRGLLQGIERADSVTLDAHKQMYVPMGAGMTLFKDPTSSNAIRHHANYILRHGSKDLGATTMEGSRSGMAMTVYASLHILGRQGYQLLIDQSIEQAKRFAQLIEAHPDFELITTPILSIFTYRLNPAVLQAKQKTQGHLPENIAALLDALTIHVQKQQREAGKSFVSRTRLSNAHCGEMAMTVFRVVLANPLTTEQTLHDILEEQRQIALNAPAWQDLVAYGNTQ